MNPATPLSMGLVALIMQISWGQATETHEMKGKGACVATVTYNSSKEMQVNSENIVWITSGKKFEENYAGKCGGIGKTDNGVYTGKFTCVYIVGSKGTYTTQIEDDEKGGTIKVTDGSGLFNGAKGEGAYKYFWMNSGGDRCLYDWDLKLVLP